MASSADIKFTPSVIASIYCKIFSVTCSGCSYEHTPDFRQTGARVYDDQVSRHLHGINGTFINFFASLLKDEDLLLHIVVLRYLKAMVFGRGALLLRPRVTVSWALGARELINVFAIHTTSFLS